MHSNSTKIIIINAIRILTFCGVNVQTQHAIIFTTKLLELDQGGDIMWGELSVFFCCYRACNIAQIFKFGSVKILLHYQKNLLTFDW